jgi:Gas vesicle protein K
VAKRHNKRQTRGRSTGHSAASKRGRRSTAATSVRRKPRRARVVAKAGGLTVTELAELKELRKQLERGAADRSPLRWNANPEDVQRSVAHLVLTLVDFIRKLLERQAIRRMESGTLTEQEIEDVGRALMRLEETVYDIAAKFGIQPEELNLDLGPVGKLV